MKKLIEIDYNELWISERQIIELLTPITFGVKVYKNKEKLCVDEASQQCLNCPAYFTQER